MTTLAAPALELPAVDYGHVEAVVVHFDDLDPMGLMHNARYALLLERGLSRYWAARGHSFVDGRPTSADMVHAVREFAITYHRPITGTGPVALHFWVDRLGSSSATYGFRFLSLDGEHLYADGRRVHVRFDLATGRPTPWSDEARVIATGLLAPQA